jgi:hypothetical protein
MRCERLSDVQDPSKVDIEDIVPIALELFQAFIERKGRSGPRCSSIVLKDMHLG